MADYKIDQLNASIKNNTLAMNKVEETLTQTLRLSNPGKIGTPEFKAQVKSLTSQFQKKINSDKKKLASLQASLQATPYVPPKNPMAPNVPASLAADPNLLGEISRAGGIDFNNIGTFQVGGVGNKTLVWLGYKGSTGKLQLDPATGKPVRDSGVLSDLKYAPTYAATWWTDTALQKKIIGAYASKGVTLNLQDGFQVWNGLVNMAAQVYSGGAGAKMTPFDLLNDTLKGIKGPKGRQTTTSEDIRRYSDAEVSALINQYASSYVNRVANAQEMAKMLPDLKKKLESPSTSKNIPIGDTKTKTISNPSFSAADIDNYVKNFYVGTTDYLENKSQSFMDFISRNR